MFVRLRESLRPALNLRFLRNCLHSAPWTSATQCIAVTGSTRAVLPSCPIFSKYSEDRSEIEWCPKLHQFSAK